MSKKLLVGFLSAAAAFASSVSSWGVPISIPFTSALSAPFDNAGLQVVISNTVVAINRTRAAPLPVVITNLADGIKVERDVAPPANSKYPAFSANTFGLEIPTDDFEYLLLHWGDGPADPISELWYLGDQRATAHFFVAPGQGALSFYALFSAGEGSELPDTAGSAALALAAATGVLLVARRRLGT